MLRILQWTILALLCGITAAGAQERARLALVIGNSDYRLAPKLANPLRDAEAVANTLTAIGFSVDRASDTDQNQLRAAVREFAGKVGDAGPDATAFVYYAGHGVQLAGVNYLVPVDAAIKRSSDVGLASVSMDEILAALDRTPAKTRVIVLDACRDNPFAVADAAAATERQIAIEPSADVPTIVPASAAPEGTSRGLALASGLARPQSGPGTLIAFATAPGEVALDGEGNNSPYAGALAELARQPGLSLESLFRRVRLRVHTTTGGKQTPWETSSLTEEIVLVPDSSTPVAGGSIPAGGVTPIAASNLVLSSKDIWTSAVDGSDKFLTGLALDDSAVLAMPRGRALERVIVRLPANGAGTPQVLELSAGKGNASGEFKPFARLRLQGGGRAEQSFTLAPQEIEFLKVRIAAAPDGAVIVPKLAFVTRSDREPAGPPATLARLGPDVAFDRVVLDGSAAALKAYVEAFPNDARSARFRSLVTSDEEMTAWLIAVSLDTPEAYRDFQQRFPGGIYAGEAALRLAELLAGARPLARLAALGNANVCPVPNNIIVPPLAPVLPQRSGPTPPPSPPQQRDTRLPTQPPAIAPPVVDTPPVVDAPPVEPVRAIPDPILPIGPIGPIFIPPDRRDPKPTDPHDPYPGDTSDHPSDGKPCRGKSCGTGTSTPDPSHDTPYPGDTKEPGKGKGDTTTDGRPCRGKACRDSSASTDNPRGEGREGRGKNDGERGKNVDERGKAGGEDRGKRGGEIRDRSVEKVDSPRAGREARSRGGRDRIDAVGGSRNTGPRNAGGGGGRNRFEGLPDPPRGGGGRRFSGGQEFDGGGGGRGGRGFGGGGGGRGGRFDGGGGGGFDGGDRIPRRFGGGGGGGGGRRGGGGGGFGGGFEAGF